MFSFTGEETPEEENDEDEEEELEDITNSLFCEVRLDPLFSCSKVSSGSLW